MTTFDAGPMTLEKVRDFVWELPREGDMRVPARVLASEALLSEIAEDKTLEQLRNTTHLPGIQKYAVCMPDGHQGYGFPVGGVAGIDAKDGCISPGAVGYDINCLSGSSEVLLEFGRRRRIDSLDESFEDERAAVAAPGCPQSAIRLFTESPDKQVYELTTATGQSIEATPDHPFLTPDGAVEVDELEPGDLVNVYPFDGLPHEDPPEGVVLDESDFADANPQLRQSLTERDLLPLSPSDDAFGRLLKLIGYHTGDGSFRGDQTWFYGQPTDLKSIAEDIEALGFTASRIFERDREHDIGGQQFETTEYSIRLTSRAFKELLIRLGAPERPKADADFTTPACLDHLPEWQRALYLSTFFGAEMSALDTVSEKNFYAPSVSHNRLEEHESAGQQFMRDLMRHLEFLGIETNTLERVEETETDSGTSVRFRFGISSRSENLLRFLTTVGYRYSASKQRTGLLAAHYLRLKEQTIDQRAMAAEKAQTLANGGLPPKTVKKQVAGVNDRFVERSMYGQRKGRPRPNADFPTFAEFRESNTIHNDGTIKTELVSIERVGRTTVYDIGVAHDAHTFIANGYAVSNCGVRMLRTNMTYDDLRGRETELVEALFANVPSGLGGGGVFEGSTADVDAILSRGLDWALEHDYAVPADLDHCEDEGRRPEADASAVSDKAKERGKSQVGSLGSGNHFLEVQRVTDVYLDDVAADFGLEPDQVVVLIHCGSRGLGHQVCTDFLREIEQTHAGLLEQLPDKELAAAPAGSHLADEYYRAMCAAINFAWVNRQLISHQTRRVFERIFDEDWESLGMDLLYDVAHNIAKKEVHEVDGKQRELYVHRKGATRAFPAGRPEVPAAYRDVGQPVIIPGSMGAGSYVLRGGEASLSETFGSTAHGAGRLMSRTQAKKEFWGEDVMDDLRDRNQVYIKAQSGATVAEEAPGVYKDVDEVVRVSDALGIGDTVARTFPVCNIKG